MKIKPVAGERRKELRSKHPLYKCISGDIVWELFQEQEHDDATCNLFMDKVLADMDLTLSVMDALEKCPSLYLGYTMEETGCAQCEIYVAKLVSANDLTWYDFLPPFSVGCKVLPKIVNVVEATTLFANGSVSTVENIQPVRSLMCKQWEK